VLDASEHRPADPHLKKHGQIIHLRDEGSAAAHDQTEIVHACFIRASAQDGICEKFLFPMVVHGKKIILKCLLKFRTEVEPIIGIVKQVGNVISHTHEGIPVLFDPEKLRNVILRFVLSQDI